MLKTEYRCNLWQVRNEIGYCAYALRHYGKSAHAANTFAIFYKKESCK